MRNRYLDPAHTIIERLGGLDNVAKASRASKSRVCRWRLPKIKGGTGGLIPQQRQERILDWAHKRGIDLAPADFFVKRVRRAVDPKSRVPREKATAAVA